MQYRHDLVPGATFFFTVVTADCRPLFAVDKNIETLRQAFRTVRSKRPFILDAAVILPDHLHCIWTLPPGDADFATRWRLIKTWFTKHCDLDGASGYAALTRPTNLWKRHLIVPASRGGVKWNKLHGEEVVVLAVAHGKRKPYYWLARATDK